MCSTQRPFPCRAFASAVALAFAATLAAGCATSFEEAHDCATSADCPITARCASRACVKNTPPSASVALPPGVIEATAALTFDASASSDPDAGDRIASRAWAFRSVSAPCEAPTVAGTEPTATVRFACAGTFSVDLTVWDELGASATASHAFEVAPYSGPPLLQLGPDVVVGHRCASGRCATSERVTLSAVPTGAAPAGLTLTWTVEPPPGRPLDAHRRVTFSPGPEAPAPEVTIETDGQAISGDWVFRVHARVGLELVATGTIRVSVGNTPPVVAETISVPPHRLEGARFVAEGDVPFTISDPDGDELLAPAVEWRHAGDGPAASFSGRVLDSPGRVSFAIAVPYATPSDAAHLIGGVGLERTIRFSVSDVNGGTTAEVWPVLVGNNPPQLARDLAPAVGHSFDAAASAYVARALIATWSDPDGDPISAVPGVTTGDAACPTLTVNNNVAGVECRVPFTGTPDLAALVGVRRITHRVRDPWDAAAEPTTSFTVTNRPPVLVAAPVSARTTCTRGPCCIVNWTNIGPVCVASPLSGAPVTTTASGWVDDDGDPLEVSATGAPSTVCTSATCGVPLRYDGSSRCLADSERAFILRFETSASDGAATASGTIPMTLSCG